MESEAKVFSVIVHCGNGKVENYNCLAKNDVRARPMGVAAMIDSYRAAGASLPGVSFCEVRLVCHVDVLPESLSDVVKSDPIPE